MIFLVYMNVFSLDIQALYICLDLLRIENLHQP
jgi:hypothetical protein